MGFLTHLLAFSKENEWSVGEALARMVLPFPLLHGKVREREREAKLSGVPVSAPAHFPLQGDFLFSQNTVRLRKDLHASKPTLTHYLIQDKSSLALINTGLLSIYHTYKLCAHSVSQTYPHMTSWYTDAHTHTHARTYAQMDWPWQLLDTRRLYHADELLFSSCPVRRQRCGIRSATCRTRKEPQSAFFHAEFRSMEPTKDF